MIEITCGQLLKTISVINVSKKCATINLIIRSDLFLVYQYPIAASANPFNLIFGTIAINVK